MRLPTLLAALLLALPAAAQTPPTGSTTPAAPPPAGTPAQPATPPATAPATTPPTAALPSTPAQPTSRSASRSSGGHRRLTQAERFEQANTTHDGKLTLDQAKAAHMNAVARDFTAIDKDHKGYVTMANIRDHRREVRAARKAAAAQKS